MINWHKSFTGSMAENIKYHVRALWYTHEPQKVSENDHVKILWDIDVQTDNVIQHRRPDIIVVERIRQMCTIVAVAVPGDSKVGKKEKENIEKYQDLARDLRRLRNMKTKVIPIVIEALGTTPKQLRRHLDDVGVPDRVQTLQKAALLETARILRKVLEV
ncbi:uncharacterized protein [Diadema setosum]|uniref:uncharacterized protein n=1 Tax=Diadema setosum TaxID=31175 RepID=UPI003B3A0043